MYKIDIFIVSECNVSYMRDFVKKNQAAILFRAGGHTPVKLSTCFTGHALISDYGCYCNSVKDYLLEVKGTLRLKLEVICQRSLSLVLCYLSLVKTLVGGRWSTVKNR